MDVIAKIIRDRREDILRLWTEQAVKTASARGLHGPEFLNFMPKYLASLGGAEQPPSALAKRQRLLLEDHVSSRIRQGFHSAEVVEEFALLGRCIARMWAAAPPRG